MGLSRKGIRAVVVVQSYFAFTPLFKILRRAQICVISPALNFDFRMYQFIVKMRNSQYREQPVNNNLIDALMTNNTAGCIKIGKFIIYLPIVQC